MRRTILKTEDPVPVWDIIQERNFWERMLNYKLSFFLLFLVIVIVGTSIAQTKELALFILSLSVIILWLLTLSLINTTRKVNIAIKELSKDPNHPTSLVDKKAKGKLIRLITGFVLPVFLSSIITIIFLAGLTGVYNFNLPTKQNIIKSVEKNADKLLEKKPKKVNNSKYFRDIDSVTR